jgi:hypothetical protein
MNDWVVFSSLATAAGTLVLAVATFASVRSANRSARVAEESLLAGLRPLLVPSRLEDAPIKVTFVDDHKVLVSGGGGTAEMSEDAIYLTMSLRNAGSGLAVLHGWRSQLDLESPRYLERPGVESFRRLTRDLFVAAGDVAFWQGTYRDPYEPEFEAVRTLINDRAHIVIDLLYGDHLGGQRMISRFSLLPRSDDGWMVTSSRHWNVDRPDPR